MTLVIALREGRPEPAALDYVRKVVMEGGLAAFPTDTFYALGANALNAGAVKNLYRVKGRDPSKPVPIFSDSLKAAMDLAPDLPPAAMELCRRFWPGPLTLVLPASPHLPKELLGGEDKIGIRVPDHPAALAILQACGVPITGTSANISGASDPSSAQDVMRQLGGRIDVIVDGGPCPLGVGSTVVEITPEGPKLVRPGALPWDEIEKAFADRGPT